MRVLVTGATGFVGRRLVDRLLEEGHAVHVLVRDPSAHAFPDGVTVFAGSIGDPNEVVPAAKDCTVLVHAAGESSHRASARALGWINVAGTENVVAAAKHAGVRKLIHVSCTDVTIHAGPRNSWNEDRTAPGGPLSHYGRSKLSAEEIVIGSGGRGAEVPFDTVVLRPSLLWGPGDRRNAPRWCREGRRGLPLLGRGTNLVATTYVDNLVEAIVRALDSEEVVGSVVNIVDGELTLASDFYAGVCEALGLPAPRKSTIGFRAELAIARTRRRLRRPGPWPTDVVHRGQTTSFDQSRALALLGYESPVLVSAGLEKLAAWANEKGGAEALAENLRAPALDSDVVEQIAGAG